MSKDLFSIEMAADKVGGTFEMEHMKKII